MKQPDINEEYFTRVNEACIESDLSFSFLDCSFRHFVNGLLVSARMAQMNYVHDSMGL